MSRTGPASQYPFRLLYEGIYTIHEGSLLIYKGFCWRGIAAALSGLSAVIACFMLYDQCRPAPGLASCLVLDHYRQSSIYGNCTLQIPVNVSWSLIF